MASCLGEKTDYRIHGHRFLKIPIMFVFCSSFEGSKRGAVGVSKAREALEVGQGVNYGENVP